MGDGGVFEHILVFRVKTELSPWYCKTRRGGIALSRTRNAINLYPGKVYFCVFRIRRNKVYVVSNPERKKKVSTASDDPSVNLDEPRTWRAQHSTAQHGTAHHVHGTILGQRARVSSKNQNHHHPLFSFF